MGSPSCPSSKPLHQWSYTSGLAIVLGIWGDCHCQHTPARHAFVSFSGSILIPRKKSRKTTGSSIAVQNSKSGVTHLSSLHLHSRLLSFNRRTHDVRLPLGFRLGSGLSLRIPLPPQQDTLRISCAAPPGAANVVEAVAGQVAGARIGQADLAALAVPVLEQVAVVAARRAPRRHLVVPAGRHVVAQPKALRVEGAGPVPEGPFAEVDAQRRAAAVEVLGRQVGVVDGDEAGELGDVGGLGSGGGSGDAGGCQRERDEGDGSAEQHGDLV